MHETRAPTPQPPAQPVAQHMPAPQPAGHQTLSPQPLLSHRHNVLWIIAGLLAVIAAGLWTQPGALLPPAFAQNQPAAGARGIVALPGQIDQNRFGLFMIDVDQGTLWCYEIEPAGGAKQLRLVAARSWVYDRYLQDFNCAAPNFRTVADLVAQQRAQPAAPDSVPPPGAENRPDPAPPRNPATPGGPGGGN